jgi:hypothetical protein
LARWWNTDASRDGASLPVDENGQVGVDVVDELLGRLALNAVDGLAVGLARQGREQGCLAIRGTVCSRGLLVPPRDCHDEDGDERSGDNRKDPPTTQR